MQKQKLLPILLVVFVITLIPIYNVNATAVGKINPKSISILKDQTVSFTIKITSGYNASATYQIKVFDPDSAIVYVETLTFDNNNESTFEYTFDESGIWYVKLYENDNLIATAKIEVMDIIETILPYIMLIISITIVFAIFEELKKAI